MYIQDRFGSQSTRPRLTGIVRERKKKITYNLSAQLILEARAVAHKTETNVDKLNYLSLGYNKEDTRLMLGYVIEEKKRKKRKQSVKRQ
ncbi:hypothetical protein TNCV_3751011 [Trichonephila clavipes]|uniref:Uncharacterized protein n=1 Tax=Trichonephila clavipes TaxID=2585209 RepID=A0A8X6R1T4_TRICX|nr:hypothetical protein TNCV_3751011 [Trichonephila clavipes]